MNRQSHPFWRVCGLVAEFEQVYLMLRLGENFEAARHAFKMLEAGVLLREMLREKIPAGRAARLEEHAVRRAHARMHARGLVDSLGRSSSPAQVVASTHSVDPPKDEE